ncbi:beta-glucan synthesis-associated protein KRE6 [Sugiyamaella lignohabitans]|uniref:Beta-glucan synthesis-associated protein KRE6 n=1 Tax=Sugiyamaella lignohabitans TaxID=796027 RepID=A0A167C667_9ASCO|nr:beta-glucan synthesis-associated protein KRE6 [Sugiyamaella lignohabitans]ANB11269.1 beta-glucan synthesis-associated protein KRE6 [Sugiyamaella lignohabitans]
MVNPNLPPPPQGSYYPLDSDANSPYNPFNSETHSLASDMSENVLHSGSGGSSANLALNSSSSRAAPQQVIRDYGDEYDDEYDESNGGANRGITQNYNTPPAVPPHRPMATANSTGSSSSSSQGYPTGNGTGSNNGYHQPPHNGMGATPLSRNSSGSFIAMGSSEFDRYPHRISSAAPSINSASGAPLLRQQYGGVGPAGSLHPQSAGHYGPGMRNSTMSDRSGSSETSSMEHDYSGNNPFVVNADFSPFGGYPASSFPLHLDEKEADDYLHNPDPILDEKYNRKCQKMDKRGWGSVGGLLCLLIGGICLFIVYPVLTYSGVSIQKPAVTTQVFEVLTNYEYSHLQALRTNLVDKDTPQDAMTRTAKDGSQWQLVFSDEFNVEGRTFYDGDDQFWTAPDFNYAATQDLEWYSPDAATTANGTLVITLDAFKNHNLFYRSGMLQSWNKFCFTQGMLEVSVLLPGHGTTPGLWPGVWTLGNLARAGYSATSEGVWPYGYNSCDAGITPNQSSTDGISYLPGQRLNSCTCPGHDHPNEGTGRGAPEIDAIEGTVVSNPDNGVASQSLQLAPFDIWYMPNYDFIEIHNKSITAMNTYAGGPFQQAISGTTMLNTDWYEFGGANNYQSYGFEYLNDDVNGYIRWYVGHTPTYTLYAPAIGPNGNVGARQISKEPMSIILNLGISNSWTYIAWNDLVWPSHMRIDYVRLYQPSDQVSLTCDPPDYPTYDYIQDHLNAYSNPNLTSWNMAGYAFPPNKLTGNC